MKTCKIKRDGKLITYSAIGDVVKKPDENLFSEGFQMNWYGNSESQDLGVLNSSGDTGGPYDPRIHTTSSATMPGSTSGTTSSKKSFVNSDDVYNVGLKKADQSNASTSKVINDIADMTGEVVEPFLKQNKDGLQLLVVEDEKSESKPWSERKFLGTSMGNIGRGMLGLGALTTAVGSFLSEPRKRDLKNSIGDKIGWNRIFDNKYASEGGNLYANAGAIVSAIGAAGQLVGNAYQAAQLDVDPKAVSKGISGANENVNAIEEQHNESNYDDLFNAMDNYTDLEHLNYTKNTDFDSDTTGSVALNAIGSGLSGAGAGMTFGGIGAGIGAILGVSSSLLGAGIKAKNAIKAADKTNKQIAKTNDHIDEVNKFNHRGFDNAFDNIATLQVLNALMNYTSEGGLHNSFNIKPINDKGMESVKLDLPNSNKVQFEPYLILKHDDGGDLKGVYDLDNEQIKELLKQGYILLIL